MGGSASDNNIMPHKSINIKKLMYQMITEKTGHSLWQVEKHADRDRWFTAEQAKEYGFIDQVIRTAAQAADEGRPAHQK
jgi:ATP-dependent Clp protease protease subunit